MQNIVNGGVYSVNFTGISPQMNGNHPSVLFRTLKESDLYLAVPLTTFKDERWRKTKKFGYGMRLKNSNSIAKIDKFIVLHKNQISSRWKDYATNDFIIISEIDLKRLIVKTNDYVKLSLNNVEKEYGKYLMVYDLFKKNISEMRSFYDEFMSLKKDEIIKFKFSSENSFKIITNNENEFSFQIKKSELNEISMIDIKQIIEAELKNSSFQIHQENIIIKIIREGIDN